MIIRLLLLFFFPQVFSVKELQSSYLNIKNDLYSSDLVHGECTFKYLVNELTTDYGDLIQVLSSSDGDGIVLKKSINPVKDLNSVVDLRNEMKEVAFMTNIKLDYSEIAPANILFHASHIFRKIIEEQKSLLEMVSSLDTATKEEVNDQLHKDLYNFLFYTFVKKSPEELKLANTLSKKRACDPVLHDSLLTLIHALIRFPCIKMSNTDSAEMVRFSKLFCLTIF